MTHKVLVSLNDHAWEKIKDKDKENISEFFNKLLENEFDFNQKEEEIILQELKHFKETGQCWKLNKIKKSPSVQNF